MTAVNIGYMTLTGFGDLWVLLAMTVVGNAGICKDNMKKILIILVISGLIQCLFSIAVDNTITIKQLAAEYKSAMNTRAQKAVMEKLSRAEIKSEQDIDLLTDIIRRSENDKDGQNIAMNAVIMVCDRKEYKIYEDKFIKLLGDSDKNVRITAIGALGLVKSEKSVPYLRKILKDISKTKYNIYKAVSYRKAVESVYEPGIAAISLGQLKDTTSIPFIVENYDYLSNFAGDALVMMGKEGVKAILEISKNAKEGEPKPIQALSRLDDPNAKDVLVEFLNDDKNDIWLRLDVLDVLVRNLKDKTIIDGLRKNYFNYEMDIRNEIVKFTTEHENLQFLVWVLENEKEALIIINAIENIAVFKDSSTLHVLERYSKHPDKTIRLTVISAIEKIKGER